MPELLKVILKIIVCSTLLGLTIKLNEIILKLELKNYINTDAKYNNKT